MLCSHSLYYYNSNKDEPSKLTPTLSLLSNNLQQDTDNSDWGLSWYSSVSPEYDVDNT
jgi:hypothetical protein